MKNISVLLSGHNKKILSRKENQYRSNCRNKAECLLNNRCLTPRIIYQSDALTNLNESKTFYIGLADVSFKESYINHTRDFRNQLHEKARNSQIIFGG